LPDLLNEKFRGRGEVEKAWGQRRDFFLGRYNTEKESGEIERGARMTGGILAQERMVAAGELAVEKRDCIFADPNPHKDISQ
jgi:hypothetical protein